MDHTTLQGRVQMMMLQIVPFFLAVVFHEFGHGWMAKKFGDTTASDQGRLTLNPAAHIDPIGTLAIPILNMVTGIPLLFGWAKPVPINPSRFKNYRRGLFWVSLAGPLTNILMALVCAFGYAIFKRTLPATFELAEPLQFMSIIGVQINLGLAIFNCLPIPPLDGGKVLESFLSYNATQKLRVIESYSFFILIALLWSGALSFITGPISIISELFLRLAQFTIYSIP